MVNKTGIIIGRLSESELRKIIIDSETREIKDKFLSMLCHMLRENTEDFVISEKLKWITNKLSLGYHLGIN